MSRIGWWVIYHDPTWGDMWYEIGGPFPNEEAATDSGEEFDNTAPNGFYFVYFGRGEATTDGL